MDDTQKMLRAIMNGQSAMKQELKGEIKKLADKMETLDEKIDGVEKRLTKRIDALGKQLAVIDEDAPSGEDFEDLKQRVTVVEERLGISM